MLNFNHGLFGIEFGDLPAPACVSLGDVVMVAGKLYAGEAMVIAIWKAPTELDPVPGVHERTDQAYPQVVLRTPDGHDLHYNGDDLRVGKVISHRPPEEADFARFENGNCGLRFTQERGLHYHDPIILGIQLGPLTLVSAFDADELNQIVVPRQLGQE